MSDQSFSFLDCLFVILIAVFFGVKVCDDRHSELIPCLDRNLIYQMRLKLDLNLMEHYERHCPPPERRFNCLIPPPHGYKVTTDLTLIVKFSFIPFRSYLSFIAYAT